MIQMPRRSVTRFFIPLIDVLILMFCIFLLMPFVKATGEGGEGGESPKTAPTGAEAKDPADLSRQLEQAKRDLERTRRDLERLEKEKSAILQRLEIRTLEIDKDTGRLWYYEQKREEIRNEADARALIRADQDRVLKSGGRELYYLILYPRELSGFPLERQVRDYDRWFAEVPHGFDNPRVAK
jgi:hypothetical protein